jgi:hypothetical protein
MISETRLARRAWPGRPGSDRDCQADGSPLAVFGGPPAPRRARGRRPGRRNGRPITRAAAAPGPLALPACQWHHDRLGVTLGVAGRMPSEQRPESVGVLGNRDDHDCFPGPHFALPPAGQAAEAAWGWPVQVRPVQLGRRAPGRRVTVRVHLPGGRLGDTSMDPCRISLRAETSCQWLLVRQSHPVPPRAHSQL